MLPSNARITRFILALLVSSPALKAQKASVAEKVQAFKTYPYSDPNRVPVMGISKKVSPFYPYYVFDGYTNKSTTKNWKVVELENPYIKVQVLPEVGGKVMGATEKSTGEEFVYTNHVMKFRAIGIRGPWTSGGIEHNFGLDLGHAPWAAAPVDYVMLDNPDGSVTCVVGGIDLASRTQWRVKIVLPKDKAYFETQSLWYNPLPLHDSYLSWENAAFRASDDMQFFFPGTHHIGHDGLASPWPIDQNGVDLSYYKNVNAGGDKSYHVMGTHTSWFGGYWHNKNFGFGHWAPYSDAPGKKLWIWSRAREGAIWEDLLTDTDGQYIEAQSGVTFNQAAERSGFHSPFNQKNLGPFYAETKTEYWFPVKAAGGMVDASPYGTLNVVAGGDSLKIIINPISTIQDTLKVTAAGQFIYQAPLQLKPMEVYVKTIPLLKSQSEQLRVSIGNDRLVYSTKSEKVLDRPVVSANKQDFHSAERLFGLGEDENAMRNFEGAHLRYLECIKKEPTHSGALIRLAEYHYRNGQYAQGLDFARKVLAENTYNGGANYLYGALYRKLGDLTKAEEALSVATWTMEYKSGAYAQLAGIALQKQDFEKAESDARKALDFNRNNLTAYQWLGTALRKLNKAEQATQVWKDLLEIDPLSHYAHFEQYLLQPTKENQALFQNAIRNELPHETYLELAMDYVNQGQNQETKQVLALAPAYPTVSYWLAYLNRDAAPGESRKHLQNAIAMSPELVFPFRLESIPVLTWAETQQPSWKNRYYLGLIYWHIGDKENAKTQFAACKNEPDYAPFYIARGLLFQKDATQAQLDFVKANQLNPKEWRTWHYLTEFFNGQKIYEKALFKAQTAYKQFPDSPVIGIDYAKSLLDAGKFAACLQVLNKIQILPQEGAREGHNVFVLSNLANAFNLAENKKYNDALKALEKARLWPENLGTGKPHEPDTRLMDYLAAYCETQLGHAQKATEYAKEIADYTLNASKESNRNVLGNYFGVKLLRDAGKPEQASKFLETWKAEQDSLRNWEITDGSDAPEVQWILAKTQNDQARAEKLKQDLTADKRYNLTTLFFKILDLAETRKKED
ncbi:Tetratricopeptide repeat-containing protein [Dyadobacter psychrophilus]|uniref:Tetratricopeptide repeat-containing protein n=2 Tax=Dyadobacter psychrophilus TaxID=651661 RepID=A0A1T5DG19_9BACT|nr:Tetratricopeptide repeat-containing protein [Dyadobacter psychrophilus]